MRDNPTIQDVNEFLRNHFGIQLDTKESIAPSEKPTLKAVPTDIEVELQAEKQSTPKAVATDIKQPVKKARWGLESLLDELLGNGWEEMDESELLRLAEVCNIQWKETKDIECRVIAGVIWELTGNVKKIEKLNYVIPWWYGSNKSD